jgi:hypothetical protein
MGTSNKHKNIMAKNKFTITEADKGKTVVVTYEQR